MTWTVRLTYVTCQVLSGSTIGLNAAGNTHRSCVFHENKNVDFTLVFTSGVGWDFDPASDIFPDCELKTHKIFAFVSNQWKQW